MKKKTLLTIALVTFTLLAGGAAVYLGLQISQVPEELPETGVSGVNCSCNRYNTFCGGETCNFSGYSDTTCPPNYTMSCASLNNASCREPKDSCECSCDGWPAPKPGYYVIPCGNYKGKSNQYQEYYTRNCAACNNPYFCVQCYEKKSVTTPPVTTTRPPVTTTQPPVTTTQPPVTTTQPPVTTTRPPVTTTQPPVTTTRPPVTTTRPPITTTQPPVTTTKPPVTTTTVVTTTVPPTTIIPATALVSDEVDRVLIGFGLLILGLALYKSGFYLNIGNVLWNKGGNQVWGGINETGSKLNRGLDSIWYSLVDVQNDIESFFMKLGYRITALFKLVSNFFLSIYDRISIIVLSIISGVLRLSIITVKTIKNLDKKLGRKDKRSVFEERILEETEEE